MGIFLRAVLGWLVWLMVFWIQINVSIVIHIHKVLVQIQYPHHLEVQYLSFLQCVVEMWKCAAHVLAMV